MAALLAAVPVAALIAALPAGPPLAGAAYGTRAATAPQTCLSMVELSVTSAQAAAAVRHWTPQRIAAATSPSQAALARAIAARQSRPRARAGQAAIPARHLVRECVPASSLASAAASSAAVVPHTQYKLGGYPTVGKFFFDILHINFGLGCTATVINDQNNKPRNASMLVLTAAHCIYGEVGGISGGTDDWSFAPGWYKTRNGQNKEPFGLWQIKHAYYPRQWYVCYKIKGGQLCQFNPPYDFAVMLVVPRHGHGVGYYTGQDGWKINMPRTEKVTILGIPDASSNRYTLVNTTISHTVTEHVTGEVDDYSYRARKASTPGFADGSSGGPWFYHYSSKQALGYLLGDTGGYQFGGNTDSPSYSPYWTSAFSSLVAYVATKE